MIETLVPIIVLKSYNKDNLWIGPIDELRHQVFSITWVYLHEEGGMGYLTHEQAKSYEKRSINFRDIALKNLFDRSPGLFTHSKYDGDEFVYGIMMQEDGLGSSRLLLLNEFVYEETDSVFPNGYLFALPERSIAMVIRKDASSDNIKKFSELAKNCFENGTTPMSPELFEPDDLITSQVEP